MLKQRKASHLRKQLLGAEIVLVALLRNLLLGVEQFAQKLSGVRCGGRCRRPATREPTTAVDVRGLLDWAPGFVDRCQDE